MGNYSVKWAVIGIASALLVLDLVWLSFAIGPVFKKTLGDWVRADILYVPAAAFYALYVVGIYFFAVKPAYAQPRYLASALARGAFLGLLAYGTYDLTNLATLRAWTVSLAIIDMSWGTFLTAVAAVTGAWFGHRFR
jgi:uncharacterized membrane protein